MVTPIPISEFKQKEKLETDALIVTDESQFICINPEEATKEGTIVKAFGCGTLCHACEVGTMYLIPNKVHPEKGGLVHCTNPNCYLNLNNRKNVVENPVILIYHPKVDE